MKKFILIFSIIGFLPVMGQEEEIANDSIADENAPGLILINSETTEEAAAAESSEGNVKDSTYIKLGNRNINIIDENNNTVISIAKEVVNTDSSDNCSDKSDKFKGHWEGISMGMNNFLDKDYSMSRTTEMQFMEVNTNRSININLNFAQLSIPIITDRVGFVTGFGFELANYRFSNDNNIQKVDGQIQSLTFPDENVIKSKLNVVWLTLPVLAEFQLLKGKRDKRLFMNAGVTAGLKLHSHSKVVTEDADSDKQKEKDPGDFYINPLKFGATARIGYDDASVYTTYYFTSLFEKNKGPELYPISFGLAFSF